MTAVLYVLGMMFTTLALVWSVHLSGRIADLRFRAERLRDERQSYADEVDRLRVELNEAELVEQWERS